jgi:hypothetical protein
MTLRLLFLALCMSGCTGARSPRPASNEPPPGSSQAPPPPTSGDAAAPSREPVPVVVTGVLIRRDAVVEICPGSAYAPCAGIEVVGQVPEAWLSTPERVAVWHVSGRFDGSKLSLSGAEPSKLGDRPNYRNACAEFQEPRAGQNADDRLSADVAAVIAEEAQRVAGHFWDMQRQTMVISVKGDTTELTKRVRARFPKSRICIQPARFSEQELEQARARADDILKDGGVVWSSSSIDVVQNRVVYDAEVLDAPTLAKLRQEAGDAVLVTAFIRLPEHALDQLPVASQRGDVPLVTETSRNAGRMNALGRFSVHYDAARHCVYLQDSTGNRLLPVWPFGYWATKNPFVVYDYDDQPVGSPGAVVEFGGGNVDVQHVKAPSSCGAKTAWIGAPLAPSRLRP